MRGDLRETYKPLIELNCIDMGKKIHFGKESRIWVQISKIRNKPLVAEIRGNMFTKRVANVQNSQPWIKSSITSKVQSQDQWFSGL